MTEPVSNVSERLPKSAEEADLLKAAISDLLARIPDTWAEFEHDQLTDVQTDALFLLTAAGMVERRGWMRSSIANHPTCFEIRFQATGEGGFAKALEAVHAAEYAVWADAWRQWKAGETGHVSPFQIEAVKPQEWRLTDQGVIARGDLDGTNPNPRPADVFDFVLKRGSWGPGHWARIALSNPQKLRDNTGLIAQHAHATGQHWTELPRPPVSGDGLIVTIRKIEQPAGPQAVNVANWQAGGDAFAQAFGPLLEQMFQRMSETGHGTRDDSTDAADALTQLRATYAAAMDENGERIVAIAADASKSADERMRRISEIDCRAYAWLSPKWAELLGVTDAAIRKTYWWRKERASRDRPE